MITKKNFKYYKVSILFQAREFANELDSTKALRNPTLWLEGSIGSNENVNNVATSIVSEAYAKLLTILFSHFHRVKHMLTVLLTY